MKKIIITLILFFGLELSLNAEVKRIFSGNINAKITIIAYESLTCSHCANFHKDVYPQLKKDYIDTKLMMVNTLITHILDVIAIVKKQHSRKVILTPVGDKKGYLP